MDNETTAALPVDFQEIGTDAQLGALYGALAQARAEFTKIQKDRTVSIKSDKGSYTFNYAELENSLEATVPFLSKHGLVVIQPATTSVVRTILAHKDGGRVVSTMAIPEARDIKTYGGHITYLRRYSYNAMLCLSADADLNDMPEAKRGETSAVSHKREGEQRRSPTQTPTSPSPSNEQNTQRSPGSASGSKPASVRPPPDEAPTDEQRAVVKSLLLKLGATNAVGANDMVHRHVGATLSTITRSQTDELIPKLEAEVKAKVSGLQEQINAKESRS